MQRKDWKTMTGSELVHGIEESGRGPGKHVLSGRSSNNE